MRLVVVIQCEDVVKRCCGNLLPPQTGESRHEAPQRGHD